MNRSTRLESEIAKFTSIQLEMPMYDIGSNDYSIEEIDALVSEIGAASSKTYVNDGNGWNKTLRQTITDLVNSIYSLDGETFETLEELEAFRNS